MSLPASLLRPSAALPAVLLLVGAAAGVHGAGRARAADCPPPATLPDDAPPPAPREFRAAWLTPVDGGEWPTRPGLTDDAQRAELVTALDRAAALGLNAVVLHVRPAADALYPTARAPWSSYLVGADGRAPRYDPLAFALEEAHRRGLQLHVWFNPFRAAPPDGKPAFGARALARQHPAWLVRYGSQQWIDPGIPEARRWVLDAILEVVERYDVDGVHLDDYFYPYREERVTRRRVGRGKKRRTVVTRRTLDFADDASWARHGRARGWTDRDDWRRDNVSEFVEALYREVKARRPAVQVGISPFGIWRPGHPPGVSGLDAYREIYADSRRWLREGWLDWLAPQLYWAVDGEQRRFLRLDAWWREQNSRARHLYPGLLTMRVGSRGAPWPAAEIPAQIDALRAARRGTSEAQGHVHFRLRTLVGGSPLGALLADGAYADRALPPALPWLGDSTPGAPRVTLACAADASARDSTHAGFAVATGSGVPPMGAAVPAITLGASDGPAPRWWLVQLRDTSGRWRSRLLRAGAPDALAPATVAELGGATVLGVSAVSASGVASVPTVVRLR